MRLDIRIRMVLVGVIVLRSSRVTGVTGLIITVIVNQKKMKKKKKKMIEDIVTRLREHALEGIWDFTKCSWDIQDAADEIERLRASVINTFDNGFDEIERLRALLDNTLERENKDNLRQLEIVRKIESDRNRWRATAEVLARELGKVEYADAEWHNQEGLH